MLNDATDWLALINGYHAEITAMRSPNGSAAGRATAVAWDLWLKNLCRGSITPQPHGGPDSLRTIADALSRIVESYGLPEGVLIFDSDDTPMTGSPMNLPSPTIWLPHNHREPMPKNTWRDVDRPDDVTPEARSHSPAKPRFERRGNEVTEDQKDWEKVYRECERFSKPNGYKQKTPGPWTAKFEAFWYSREDLQAWNLHAAWEKHEAARKRIARRSR